MQGRLTGMVGIAAACAALSAPAGVVTLTASDSGQDSAFVQSQHWSDWQKPHADADYEVPSGLQIRSPTIAGNYTFGGKSLTLKSGSGGLYLCGDFNLTTGANWAKVDDLRVEGGGSWPRTNAACLDGNLTVRTLVGSPFYFATWNAAKTIVVKSSLHGAEGTQLALYGPGTTYLLGNNSGYLGSIVVGGMTCYAPSIAAFGGALSTFTEKALVLQAGSALQFTQGFSQDASGDNRGIWLEGNATISVPVASDLYSPISGTAALTIQKKADVTLRYGGAMSGTASLIVQNKLQLHETFSMTDQNAMVLENGGQLASLKTSEPATVYNFTYNGGTIAVIGSIDFRGTFTKAAGKKIVLSLTGLPTGTGTEQMRVPVMSVPVSSCVLTKDDFELGMIASGISEWIDDFEVATDETTGIQTVSFLMQPYVLAVTSESTAYGNNPAHWSNNAGFVAGNNYLAQAKHVRSGYVTDEYTFPGASITLYNPYGSADNYATYMLKYKRFFCNDFRAMNWTGFMLSGKDGTSGEAQVIGGNIHVMANQGYMMMIGAIGRQGIVEATVDGSGGICLRGDGVFDFRADNSGYGGSFYVADGATLVVGNESNLGGDLTTFVGKPLQICSYGGVTAGTFRPAQSMTIANPQRKIELSDKGCVMTDEGVELTTLSPVLLWNGVKRGAGTWTLGGAAENTSGALRVEEGVLKVANADAVGPTALTFADGAEFAVAVDTGDEDLEQYGLLATGGVTIKGETLTVRLERPTDGSKVALMTVADDQAEAMLDKLRVRVGTSKADAELEVVPVTVGGTPYSCIRANVARGALIMVR